MEEFGGPGNQYRSLFTHNPDAVWLVGLDGTIQDVNAATEQLTGWNVEELRNHNWSHFLMREPAKRWEEVLAAVARGERIFHEVMFRCAGGRGVSLFVRIVPLVDGHSVTRLFVVGHDITARKALDEQLTFLAFHDPLTQLPNRSMFMRRLREAQARETYASEHWSVLYLDLDGFKVVNDSLGHDAGDDLLVAAAQRLRQCTPPTAVVARMGGDEFAILQGPSNPLAPELTAATIMEAMQAPFHIAGHEMVVSPSIGIVSGLESDEADELLRYADSAMYEAKHRGKGQYAVFDRAMASRAIERFRLEIDLRNALDRSEFTLHYQPIVNLYTGDVEGVEALIRWKHPERGQVAPGAFIPLAEETGLIVPIGRWVLREACAQLCTWQARFPERANWRINVNLSMPQIKDSSLVDDVAQVLRETRLSPHLLQLELTETSLAQGLEATTRTLSELKGLGVGLVIDDFGMGYSSLNYLRWFPVDVVKIDRTFIAGLGQNPTDMAIVQAVITVAKSLGLQVTGEGIETAEQLALLRDLHCDRGQGYYLGHPCPPEALDQSLRALEAI